MSKLVMLALASPLAFASCTTDALTTNSTSQDVASSVTVQLWDPSVNTSIDAFWDRGTGVTPAPVASMQYLVTRGDNGGPLTRGFHTAYVWEISNANHVYKVWRVAMDQYPDFQSDMNTRHGAMLAAHPGFSIFIAGTPEGGEPTVGPHIGPHGDGDTFFSQALVDNAVYNAGVVKSAWADPVNGFKAANAAEK